MKYLCISAVLSLVLVMFQYDVVVHDARSAEFMKYIPEKKAVSSLIQLIYFSISHSGVILVNRNNFYLVWDLHCI